VERATGSGRYPPLQEILRLARIKIVTKYDARAKRQCNRRTLVEPLECAQTPKSYCVWRLARSGKPVEPTGNTPNDNNESIVTSNDSALSHSILALALSASLILALSRADELPSSSGFLLTSSGGEHSCIQQQGGQVCCDRQPVPCTPRPHAPGELL
jgi:hypothetical protein